MLIGYLILLGLILFDQLIKLISVLTKVSGTSLIKVLIPNILEFHYLENTGASFGMLEGQQAFFSLITIVALIIFGYFFLDINLKEKKVFSIAIILFIAGTFGNAIDRIFRDGVVVDMLNMPILNNLISLVGLSPFIFNVADIYLNFAVVLFIIDILFLERKRVGKHEENWYKRRRLR